MFEHWKTVVGVLVLAVASLASGCSAKARTVPLPPPTASAVEVAHILMSAYQAGDAATLRQLTAGNLRLRPGDLGSISNVRWRSAISETRTYPGFAPGDVYVQFNAATSGSPDQTIPPEKDWLWGFVLARRSPSSGWLAVDDGVG